MTDKRRYAFLGNGEKVLIVKGANGERCMQGKYVDSCSGCYESLDGQPYSDYSIHPVHGCYVGSGCEECGHHGIRWVRFKVPLPSCARVPSDKVCEYCDGTGEIKVHTGEVDIVECLNCQGKGKVNDNQRDASLHK